MGTVPGKRADKPETWVLTPSNLVHLQHGNHVDDKRIGYGPNRDEDSPLAFSKRCKDETHDKSPKGNSTDELPDSGGWHQSMRTTTVVKPRIVEN